MSSTLIEVTNWLIRAVVVAQLVERLLPIPEIRGSNPVIGYIIYYQLYLKNCIEKTKIKKRGRDWPNFFKKKTNWLILR